MNSNVYHTMQRLQERGINYHPFTLESMAESCDKDTAIILCQMKTQKGMTYGSYNERESNGELVVMIVRNHQPQTIMFRRINQPLTNEALRVESVKDLRKNKAN